MLLPPVINLHIYVRLCDNINSNSVFKGHYHTLLGAAFQLYYWRRSFWVKLQAKFTEHFIRCSVIDTPVGPKFEKRMRDKRHKRHSTNRERKRVKRSSAISGYTLVSYVRILAATLWRVLCSSSDVWVGLWQRVVRLPSASQASAATLRIFLVFLADFWHELLASFVRIAVGIVMGSLHLVSHAVRGQ